MFFFLIISIFLSLLSTTIHSSSLPFISLDLPEVTLPEATLPSSTTCQIAIDSCSNLIQNLFVPNTTLGDNILHDYKNYVSKCLSSIPTIGDIYDNAFEQQLFDLSPQQLSCIQKLHNLKNDLDKARDLSHRMQNRLDLWGGSNDLTELSIRLGMLTEYLGDILKVPNSVYGVEVFRSSCVSQTIGVLGLTKLLKNIFRDSCGQISISELKRIDIVMDALFGCVLTGHSPPSNDYDKTYRFSELQTDILYRFQSVKNGVDAAMLADNICLRIRENPFTYFLSQIQVLERVQNMLETKLDGQVGCLPSLVLSLGKYSSDAKEQLERILLLNALQIQQISIACAKVMHRGEDESDLMNALVERVTKNIQETVLYVYELNHGSD